MSNLYNLDINLGSLFVCGGGGGFNLKMPMS